MATKTQRQFGAPLPEGTGDLEEMLINGDTEIDVGAPGREGQDDFATGDFYGGMLTSAEAKKKGKNFVSRERAPMRTLYDYLGNSRVVPLSDVFYLTSNELPESSETVAGGRLYTRCPVCRNLPNRGIHSVVSPNACPGHARLKYMPCPVCAQHGISARVYEEMIPNAADFVDEQDEDFVAPKLPTVADRETILQYRLNTHMAAFHPTEARAMYGIKKEEYFR